MRKSEIDALAKIDAELLEIEAQIEEELAFEQAVNKKTLLRSRALCYRRDVLLRKRKNLQKNKNIKLSREEVFDAELKRRRNEVIEIEHEIEQVNISVGNAVATFLVTNNPNLQEDVAIYNTALRTLKLKLFNKKRALDNWLSKSPSEMAYDRQRVDAKSETIIKQAAYKNRTPEDILGDNPNWAAKTNTDVSEALSMLNNAPKINQAGAESRTSSETAFDYFNKEPIYAEKIDKPRIVIDDE